MKLFKLTAAAFALVAFASCSNDDLFSSNGQNKNITSVLIADVESPDGIVTRAARNANAGGFTWQTNDKIRIYDTDLGKYDVYEFDNGFGRSGDTNLEKDPAYALYPAENIKRGYWDPTDGHVAEVKIDRVIEYSKSNGAETKDGDNVLYKMFTPMQGKVEKIDDTTVKVLEPGMQVMTGVLYMTLGQALGNAQFIKLSSASKNLSGRFLAKLDEENASLIESDDELIAASYKKDLYIDLRDLPSDKAVLYIPVIAGVNDLQVSRITGATTYDTDGAPTNGTTTLITNLDTYTFQRNRFKSVSFTYDLAADCPVALNTALAQYNEQSTDVTLNVVNAFNISAADAAKGQEIQLPEMACEVVTLNLTNDVVNTSTDNLIISGDDFEGTFVLNVADQVADGSKLPISINLPKAKVVLAGDYTQTNAANLTVTAVDELQFGDGETTTKFTQAALDLSNVATKITVESEATVTATTSITTTAAALEVKAATAATGSVAGTITGAGTVTIANAATIAGAVTSAITSTAGDINVSGTVTGNITLAGDLTISGTVTGDITTKGNVEIARTSEGVAIDAAKKLTFQRAKTLTIKQGYIGTVETDFSALGEADDKEAKITFAETGLTAIKAVTVPTPPAKLTITNKSTWTGALPTATINSFIDTSNKIYTAAQLVTFQGSTGATIDLQNDIDLANDPQNKWTKTISKTAGAVVITGNDHTISNINLNNLAKKNGTANVGFIGDATTLSVTDLTLDNVQFTMGYNNQGTSDNNTFIAAGVAGLAGTASGAITLSNVTVNLADNFGYSSYTAKSGQTVEVDATKVGVAGLVGIAGGDADLDKVVVNGALIQGYTSLGGFIGVTTGAIDIDKDSKSNITAFKSNYGDPSASNIEMNYGRIGGAVGYVAAVKNVNIAYGATTNDVVATLPTGAESELYVTVSAGSGNKLWSWSRNQQWIGFSATEAAPGTNIGTVTIGKTSTTNYDYVTPQFGADGSLTALGTGKTALYTWTAKAN